MKRFLRSILLSVCCCQLQAAVLYVRLGDYTGIQEAINDTNDGDTVIVDPCTYYENINFLGRAIILTSIDPNDPCIVAATVINGSLASDVNKGSVVTFNSAEENDSVLTGFTITGGTGSWLTTSWEFKGKRWNRCGGGVICYNMSAPTITKNIFTGNCTGQGAGIYVYGNPVNPDDPSNPPYHIQPVISYNTFVNNDADKDLGFTPPNDDYPFAEHGDGAAIACFQGVDAQIYGNTVRDNTAHDYGGGIHLRQWSNGFIEDNYIIDNNALLGGGVHITYTSSPTVRMNLIQGNYATNGGGGGVYIYFHSNPIVEKNLVTQNESTNGAGIGSYFSSNPMIRNNIVINNIGAGIRVKGDATATIINNTVVGNVADPCYAGGIDIITSGAASIIENNIIASSIGSYGIYVYASGTMPQVRYNNIWNNGGGNYNSVIGDQTGINGNISVDPLFADANNYDYHLQSNGWRWDIIREQWRWDDNTSRCIDSGNPGCGFEQELLTVPDDPNGVWAENIRVNMGAYGTTEYASLPPHGWSFLADITNNGIVDINDLEVFLNRWLETGNRNPSDLNRDQVINLPDFVKFAIDWRRHTVWY